MEGKPKYVEGTWGGGGSKRSNNPEPIIKNLLGLLARKTRYNYHLARQGRGFSILLVVPKPFIFVWLSLTYNSMHDLSAQKFLSGHSAILKRNLMIWET